MKFSLSLAALFFLLVGCTTTVPTSNNEVTQKIDGASSKLNLRRENFSNLPSWGHDDFKNFGTAYMRSCARILKKTSQNAFGSEKKYGVSQEWQIACRKFKQIDQANASQVKWFFEQNFIPYSVAAGHNEEGLFTGYYEASLKGARQRGGVYQYPLRARPNDLVMVDLGSFRDELKGQRIAGRVKNGRLKPYETHAEIINGGLPDAQDKALVWVDSAVDAFFLQIQGSGIVSMDDGSIMRVGYAGQNGHPYYAIGRELVKRGELTKGSVSMQSIRDWLEKYPDQAMDLMTTNKSYVFFEELKGAGPLGGEGVALTPMRSLAIDRSIIPYGMPVWIDIEHPKTGRINKLMVTQDTGGAIRGPVRGDYFWGYGQHAAGMAGAMKSTGRYWFLLPRTL